MSLFGETSELHPLNRFPYSEAAEAIFSPRQKFSMISWRDPNFLIKISPEAGPGSSFSLRRIPVYYSFSLILVVLDIILVSLKHNTLHCGIVYRLR